MSQSPPILHKLYENTQCNAPNHTAWIRIRDNVATILWRNSPLDRINHTLRVFEALYKDAHIYNPPANADVYFFADDIPPHYFQPFLAYCSSKDHDQTKVFAIPSFVLDLHTSGFLDLDKFGEKVIKDLDIPFEQRDDTLFWIGGVCPYRFNTFHAIKHIPHTDIRLGYNDHNFVHIHDHNKYKYLLDMQGIGWSMRLMWLMWLGSVVFVLDRDLHEFWFLDNFQPWVHYVPVAHNGSDLEEVYNRVRAMPDKGKSIAEACRQRAREILTLDFMKKRLASVLNEYVSRYGILNHKPS